MQQVINGGLQSVERNSFVSRVSRAEHALHARCHGSHAVLPQRSALQLALTAHMRTRPAGGEPSRQNSPPCTLFSPSASDFSATTHGQKLPPRQIRFRLIMQGHLWLALNAIALLHTAPLSSHSNLVAGLCCASIVFGLVCLWRLLETDVQRERCSSVEVVSCSQSLS